MYEKIYVTENVYIEYDINNENQINRATLQVVKDGKIDSLLSDKIYQGILASLIENNKNGIENQSAIDICINSWPSEYDFGKTFDFERNLRDYIGEIRKEFSILLGETDARKLLPRKRAGFGYRIVFPTANVSSHSTTSKSSLPDSISFKTLKELNDLGFTNSDIARCITKNDILTFKFPENSPQEGSAAKWQEFFEEEPIGWGFLLDKTTNSIIGNYSSVGLSIEQKQLLCDGFLMDGEIDLDETESFHRGGYNTLYILNISVIPLYNTPENRELLFDSFFNMILEQAKKGIFFKDIFFTTWRFRKHLRPYGFTEYIKKDDDSIIMAIEDFPNNLIWKHANQLIEIYNSNKEKQR